MPRDRGFRLLESDDRHRTANPASDKKDRGSHYQTRGDAISVVWNYAVTSNFTWRSLWRRSFAAQALVNVTLRNVRARIFAKETL